MSRRPADRLAALPGSSPASSAGPASLWIGWSLWQSTPPQAGFDLSLLLDGARRVLAGQSPYDPAMLAGTSPDATSLFYSYPPPVAQAMTLLAWLPDGVVLVLWGLGATAGLALVAAAGAAPAGRPDPAGGRRSARRRRAAGAAVRHRHPVRQPRRLVPARLRPARPGGPARRDQAGVRGGRGRDRHRVDGQAPPGDAAAVAGRTRDRRNAAARAPACSARRSRRRSRSWPSAWSSGGPDPGPTTSRCCGPGQAPPSWTPATSGRSRCSARSSRSMRRAARAAQIVVAIVAAGRHRPRRRPRPGPAPEHRDRDHGVARGAAGDLVPLPGGADPGGDRAPGAPAGGRAWAIAAVVVVDVAIGFTPLLWVAVAILLIACLDAARIERAPLNTRPASSAV